MKRLLYIAHRVPFPPDKGERLRAFHAIRALAKHFRVTVAALAHSAADVTAAAKLDPWCERLLVARAGGAWGWARGTAALASGRSVTEGYFRSRQLRRLIAEAAGDGLFDLVLGTSSSTLPYVLGVPAGARVLDLVDADSAKWAAYAAAARGPKAWLYAREARAVRQLEHEALTRCDAVALVSDAEVAALGPVPSGATVLAVGNGVDLDVFRPRPRPADVRPTLVFTGTMDYRPNVEGVCWFAETVWPALRRERPDLRFVVVGRNPAPAVRRLAERPGIEVTGAVPDVRPYLSEARAAVVPLLTARGIQNKVLEAMAMGRAVVASPPALEGLDLGRGTDVVEAASPASWVEAVRSLLEDDGRREALERAARARVEADFAWEARLEPLVDLCARLARGDEAKTGRAAAPEETRLPATEPVATRYRQSVTP